LQKNLPKIARYCQAIADNHPNEKGIIHTHSLDICKYLQQKLKGDRFLFREESANNEKILDDHFTTDKPTVLVSPSLTFGTDLNGDKGRFQIIVKTPFPPLGNKRIKKMAELDPEWYQQKTLSAFIQTTGRCTRSKADYSVTYVIDGKARKLLLDNKDKLPEHFIERLK
jgi:Rad3-related DNA helicase